LEAKATDTPDGNDKPLRKAFGQVRNYASQLSGTPPPFLMVVDIPRTLIVWEGWNGDWGGCWRCMLSGWRCGWGQILLRWRGRLRERIPS